MPGVVLTPEQMAVLYSLAGLVVFILAIIAIFGILPVVSDAIQIGKSGSGHIRSLHEGAASEKEIGKSGRRTGIAILVVVGGFALVLLLLVIPLMTGTPIQSTPLVLILKAIVNFFIKPIFGIEI